ncbi:hypothetical protein [Nocardioides sp. LS1]|uniref:hypothetical protein n=1 Tax=Nocardioides sp. LS1 TaxID=1027620 RepID=UPI000F6283DA|nr:hypothetical protein [Nocardioides sp. LS1]GCD89733.1 hypothetical protein NLS1_17390 [Nocardioides sp. LS1]
MAAEVHASFSGMRKYAELCRDQQRFIDKVDELVNGQCADFGAFTGFMAMFSGSYKEAHATVAEEVRRAARGAGDLGANITAVLHDFRTTDEGVKNDLGKLDVKVDAAHLGHLAGHEGGPGLPTPIKVGNAALSYLDHASDVAEHMPQHLAGLPGRTPPLPDADIRGLPTDGVELVSQVTDTIAAGESMSDAQDDENLYEDFENRHQHHEEAHR